MVVCGDEGGIHVVAENVRGLLRILAFDVEPAIDHGDLSYERFADEGEDDGNHEEYVEWLSELGLEPAEVPRMIVNAAQAKYKAVFAGWLAEYYPGADGDDD